MTRFTAFLPLFLVLGWLLSLVVMSLVLIAVAWENFPVPEA
jgi:hypothetical protein